MSGLCGWVGQVCRNGAESEALGAMLAELPTFGGELELGRVEPMAALGVRTNEQNGWHLSEAGQWYAIDGEPYWSDRPLQEVAREAGNAAALAQAHRDRGLDLFKHLHGSFALAIVDRPRQTALLAVDRFGLKSMTHQVREGGALAFASTADSLRAHPDLRLRLSPQAIYQYLYFSVVPGPATIYEQVEKLVPGQYLLFTDGTAKTDFYYRVRYGTARRADISELSRQLFALLRDSVRRSLAGYEADHIGAFLSGGLDSSTVLGLAGESLERPIKGFTMSFDAAEFDEQDFASIAARHFQAPHITYDVTPVDTLALIDHIARVYDEPFGNSSAVPTYYCAKLARDHDIGLLLAGDGGDELFAGNSRYILQEKFELYAQLPRLVRHSLESLFRNEHGATPIPGIGKMRGYIRRAKTPMPERIETYNYFESADLDALFDREYLASVDRGCAATALRNIYDRCESPSLLRRMMHLDLQLALADNDLRKVTRMCELADMQVRFPFLDQSILEFSAQVPPEVLIRFLRLRSFYRRAMVGFLPREVIAKEKHGFGLPFRLWVGRRGPLRDFVGDGLQAFARRGIVRRQFLEELLADWDTEEAKLYGQFVWYTIVLEHWFQARGL